MYGERLSVCVFFLVLGNDILTGQKNKRTVLKIARVKVVFSVTTQIWRRAEADRWTVMLVLECSSRGNKLSVPFIQKLNFLG